MANFSPRFLKFAEMNARRVGARVQPPRAVPRRVQPARNCSSPICRPGHRHARRSKRKLLQASCPTGKPAVEAQLFFQPGAPVECSLRNTCPAQAAAAAAAAAGGAPSRECTR